MCQAISLKDTPYSRASFYLLIILVLKSVLLIGQEAPIPTQVSSERSLSETTLGILQSTTAPSATETGGSMADDSLLPDKHRKIEKGGLLIEWVSKVLKPKKAIQGESPTSSPTRKSKPIWRWFNPFEPMSQSEINPPTIDPLGRRPIPQQAGSSTTTQAEGIQLFFIGF
jgi:hypothetical protein